MSFQELLWDKFFQKPGRVVVLFIVIMCFLTKNII
jgi:hypothetical protein